MNSQNHWRRNHIFKSSCASLFSNQIKTAMQTQKQNYQRDTSASVLRQRLTFMRQWQNACIHNGYSEQSSYSRLYRPSPARKESRRRAASRQLQRNVSQTEGAQQEPNVKRIFAQKNRNDQDIAASNANERDRSSPMFAFKDISRGAQKRELHSMQGATEVQKPNRSQVDDEKRTWVLEEHCRTSSALS